MARITLIYDITLQQITKTPREFVEISDGFRFVDCLFSLFQSYPEIEQRYPAGQLGFSINGDRPTEVAELHNGDVVHFSVVTSQIPINPTDIVLMEQSIHTELQALVDRYTMKHSVDEIEQMIFEEQGANEFSAMIEQVLKGAANQFASPAELDQAVELLSRAWNQLPHASLDGQSPVAFAATLRSTPQRKKRAKKRRQKGRRG